MKKHNDDYPMNDRNDDRRSCHVDMPGEFYAIFCSQHEEAEYRRCYHCNKGDDSKVEEERKAEDDDVPGRYNRNHQEALFIDL